MHDFDGRAALAEGHQWPEHRVLDDADEKLDGAGASHHRLNQEPVEARVGTRRRDAREHCRGFLPGPVGVPEIECHPADIALVGDVGRADLERHREPDFRRDRGRLLRISGLAIGQHRETVGREDGARLLRVEPGFPGDERGRDRASRPVEIGLEIVGARRRRFHQQLLVAPMAHPLHEAGNRLVGRVVGRETGSGEELPRSPRRVLAEPRGNHVAAAQHRRVESVRGGDHRARRLLGPGQCGRAVQHQHGVDPGVADQRGECVCVAPSRCVADDVDRVPMAPGRGQDRTQRGDRRFGQWGESAAGGGQGIGREYARPAAIRQDR